MPRVIFSPAALRDTERLREFLKTKNPQAAKRAVTKIFSSLRMLEQHPQIGRAIDNMSVDFRELLIPFGSAGYVARYHYSGGEIVEILAIRHYREIGFQIEN